MGKHGHDRGKTGGNGDGLHVRADRVRGDCSHLVSGNMAVPEIKPRKTRGGLASEKHDKCLSDMRSLILILAWPGQSPSLNTMPHNSISFQNWTKIFLPFGREDF